MTNDRLKVIVIDDEIMAQQSLKIMLTNYCQPLDVVGCASEISEAITLIEQEQPDVVFLDMRLGNSLGFEVVRRTSFNKFQLVVISAHADYAIDGYKHNAFDYLLKPVSPRELAQTVSAVRSKIKSTEINVEQRKIVLHSQEGHFLYSLDEIISCLAEGRYTWFYFKSAKPFLTSKNIGEYEKLLCSVKNFIRIHQSTIINVNEIRYYSKNDGGYVVMSDGAQHDISRAKRDMFRDTLGKITVTDS
jgi:two-component system LytT family response regulator